MNLITRFLTLTVLCSVFSFSSFAQEKYSKVKIPITSPEIKKFVGESLDLDHFKYEGNAMVVVLNSEELKRLKDSHYPFETVVDDMVQHTIDVNKNTTPSDILNRAVIQGNGCQKIATIIPTPVSFGTGGSLRLGAAAGNPGYFTYAEMSAAMLALQTAYPTLVTRFTIGNSAAGTPIYGVKISDNVGTDENEPEVLFTGLQHAREAIGGTSLVFFMQYLAENYANADAKIKDLVDNREIFIIPCLNPDGYAFNYGGSSGSYPVTGGGLWRKNRRNTGGGASNIGVDLNRNYSIDWGNCAGASSSCGSNVKTDDTYYGTAAFSEPETQALRDFVYTRHFINAIDQHCFGPYYSLPYGRPSLHPVLSHIDSSYYKFVPALMGMYNGHRAGNSPETVNYEVAGGIKDWLLMGDIGVGTGPKGKVYGMTGEAGGGDFWAPVAQIPQLCKENCFQNLQLAYAAGDYYEMNDRKDIAVTSLTGKFAFDIRRVGLGNGPVTISLVPISFVSSVGSPITTTLANYYDTYIDSINYTLPPTVVCGQKLQYAWKVVSGGIATYDTVTKYYNPTVLFSDDMEGTLSTNWTTAISPTGPTGWSYTTLAAFGGTHSMTESPTGNYTVSSTRTATCKTVFSLTDAKGAYLSFWVKHRAENFHDKLQVQISTNGSTWTPICGTTTVTEDNTTSEGFLNGQPALTGIRDNWTRELFDLSGYDGNATVSFRFQFTSDNDATAFAFELDDGFYLDNVKVVKITNPVIAPPAAPTASGTSICTGNTASLTATGTGIIGWYSAATGGTYLGGGSNFTTPVLSGNATYYAQDSICSPSLTRTPVLVTVKSNSTISLSSAVGTDAQTKCINTAITNITYAIGGSGTGASITAGALPAGVTGVYSLGVFTISGTPTASGTFNYTVTTSGGTCLQGSLSGTITVNANSTIALTSAAATTSQVICNNTAITNITYAIGGGGTGATITAGALPAGLTGSYSAGVFTISGTATTSGSFNYTVTTTGPCTNPSLSGTITVNTNSILTLTSAVGTNSQTVCKNSAITNITYAVTGSGTGASITAGALPAGVTGSFNTGVFTISGTPTVSGTFNYTVTTSGGGCSQASLSGTITVNNNSTISLSSAVGTDTQTKCINAAITNITYAVGGGGTGASITAGALPPGVTGSYNAGVFTISGTATASGTFNYTVTTTGPCTNPSLSGSITVNANSTISLSSAVGTDAQTKCINTAIANITYAVAGGATSASITAGALPAGVTGSYNAGVFTISGTPTASGTFNYTVTTAGPCTNPSLNGSITVNANSTIILSSAVGTDAQVKCINTAITNITYAVGGSGTGASVTAGALPAGVTGSYNAGVFTITGTPTATGTFNYTVTATGPCINPSLNGSITVRASSTLTLTSAAGTAAQTVCINNAITNTTYAIGGTATNALITAGALPAGVAGVFNAGVFTISGTPTVSGTFNYTVTATGTCANASLNGSITVTANSTISLSSAVGTNNQTVCIQNGITDITYAIGGGATGASITAGTLPSGVTGSYNAGLFTITGFGGQAGTFNYTVTTTGPCTNSSLSGSITIQPNATLDVTGGSNTNQVVCINVPIQNITYAVGGSATGVSINGSFPPGVTGSYNAGVYTISGTPTQTGTFFYQVFTTGPCSSASQSGSITVNANATLTLTSAPGTTSQTVCANTPIVNITYAIGGGATGAFLTSGFLPLGVTTSFSNGVFTISGTPTSPGNFSYGISTMGGCSIAFGNGNMTVNANSTLTLFSAAGTDAQTKCINTPITNIAYNIGGGANNASITAGALPAGITGSYSGGLFTISGTPTVSGTFNYTVTATGLCANASLSGSITVKANSTITLSSAVGTDAQTKCINTAITNITYAIGGGGTGASITAGALPAGVTGSYNAGVFTISGTPAVSGTFNYTVTTTGPCINPSLSGSITVTANSTLTLTSTGGTAAQTVCINNAITNITYSIAGGGTSASITAGALPTGVTGSYNAGVFTISGTATASGTFNYTVTTAGPCTNTSLSGSITVTANSTISLSSAVGTNNQTICIQNSITDITYAIGGGATGASITAGTLPSGVTGSYNAAVFTISGFGGEAGTFNYTVTTTGPCGNSSLSGTITVNPNSTLDVTGGSNTNQVVCINNAIQNITYSVGGSATGATISGGSLPTGVTGTYNAGVFTISGTPTQTGTFFYQVTTTGPCINQSLGGSITVNGNATMTLSSAAGTDGQTICVNNAITNITYAVGGTATGAFISSGFLPVGVTGSYSSGVFTISGTPTTPGTFTYTVSTTGGCSLVSLNGNMTVNANSTITLTSAPSTTSQTVCTNNAITNITYAVGGTATGASITAGSLPTGVAGSYSPGSFTISGTATVPGTFNYTVTTTGPCGNSSLSGTITVNANSTIVLSSLTGTDNQTICIQNPLTDITYAIGGGATSASITAGALPSGVTGSYNAGVFTISGFGGEAGTFNYTVTTTGLCGNSSLSGTITINPNSTLDVSGGSNTEQFVCVNSSIENIIYFVGGSAAGATISGLPVGVTGSYSAGVFTISGTPTQTGTFFYTVTTTGPCVNQSLGGSITVNDGATMTLSSAQGTDNQTICTNNAITNITYAVGGTATSAFISSGFLPVGVTGSFSSGVFTISGTPTTPGTFTYTVSTTGGCSLVSLNGNMTVNENSSIQLSSAAGTDAQTVCTNNQITNIVYAVGGSATGASITAGSLPAGVTGSYSLGSFTISGTPTVSGTFNYTVTTTGACGNVSLSGTITVNTGSTINLTSAIGTDNQTICTNSTITNITYVIAGGATSASITAGTLPSGVTGSYNAGVFTISGTPTASGTFNYTVTTTGPCANVSLSGTITVNVGSTINLTSAIGTDNQTTCTNSAITTITYAIAGGATSASITAGSLPAGVTGSYNAGVFTISGTPTVSGTFSYTVTTSGPCANASLSGTITVNVGSTISLTSAVGTDAQVLCSNTAITNITYSVGGGATGASITAGSLPAGVTSSFNAGVFTISGIPTASGSYSYTVTTSGPCSNVSLSGSITINLNGTISLSSAPGTNAQAVCANSAITNITYVVGGSGSGTTVTGLPAGVSGSFNAGVFTISGTPTVTGLYNYTVTTTGGACSQGSASGTIKVNAVVLASVINNVSACGSGHDGSITITPTGGTAPYTYSWTGSNGYTAGNTATISNLGFGYYNVLVTDAIGCTATLTNLHIGSAFSVVVTYSGSNSSSCGNTGSIILFGNAGVQPYTYSLDGTNYQASNTFTNLGAATYTAYVKDAAGCISSKSITITATAGLTVTSSVKNTSSCANDGTITVFRSGGFGPYTYSLDNVTYQPANLFTGLAAGTYTVYVKDSQGCMGTQTVTVTSAAPLTVTATSTKSSTCVDNGTIQATVSGGTAPYTYSLDGVTFQSSNVFTDLPADIWTVTVMDAKGCTGTADVTIAENPITVTASVVNASSCVTINGSIQVFRSGGVGPYTYSISGNNGFQSSNFFPASSGTFVVMVKDAVGCKGTLPGVFVGPVGCNPEFTSTGGGNPKYNTMKASLKIQAYPNPSTTEFTLVLNGYNTNEKVSISVTDVLGRKIYQSEENAKSEYRIGKNLKTGVYMIEVMQGKQKQSIKLIKE